MVGATVRSVWKGHRAWAGCHQLSVFQPKYGKSNVPQSDFFGDATIPHAWKRLPEFSAVWAYIPCEVCLEDQQHVRLKRWQAAEEVAHKE